MYRYNTDFYDWIDSETYKDAEIIISYIIEWIKPKSIVDFGCGEGLWLSVAKKIDDDISILGLDGEYVHKNRLKIPANNFQALDLSKRVSLNKKYDLAISTEVAEHIMEKYSDNFIDNITSVSDRILFSAAIPGQDGINHVNEQWQSYWIKRFEDKGYFANLSIRDFFWNEKEVTSWRKQNIIYFSKFKDDLIVPKRRVFDVVHPDSFINLNRRFREANEQLVYMIDNPDICKKLDDTIQRMINDYENIVICPFGKNGRLFKNILNIKYGIQEVAIIDNYVCNVNCDIFSVEILKNIKEKFIVADTCSNPQVHNEILEELCSVAKKENIYSIF